MGFGRINERKNAACGLPIEDSDTIEEETSYPSFVSRRYIEMLVRMILLFSL